MSRNVCKSIHYLQLCLYNIRVRFRKNHFHRKSQASRHFYIFILLRLKGFRKPLRQNSKHSKALVGKNRFDGSYIILSYIYHNIWLEPLEIQSTFYQTGFIQMSLLFYILNNNNLILKNMIRKNRIFLRIFPRF